MGNIEYFLELNHPISLLFISYSLVFCLMAGFWFIGRLLRNYTVVDIAWTLSLFLANLIYYFFAEGYRYRKSLILIMVSIWSFRLAWYLCLRVFTHEEDPRYREFREKYKKENPSTVDRKFFWNIFQFQGLLSIVISIPFLVICMNAERNLGILEFISLFIWFLGLVGETVADLQMMIFKSKKENYHRTCQQGLWYYSRHPNYFFEWLIWVSYGLFAFSAKPYGPFMLLYPFLMYILLTRFTGIPLSEKQAIAKRGEEYREYQRTTSAFFPWFKKESRASR
ncbi:MAG: DUF1295 domain-containing protein [Leptospiraceae bacterium]|nr:DUF1295 domain-containing protein [Leptospiraceae bacterium]MCP5502329.1 DUF1295 domain-containing protein [Leptospiraceae bacterium]